SSETCTDGASISLTSAGIRSSGRPRVTRSRPSRSSRNWRNESHRNCIRRLPEDASKRGSRTKHANTSSLSAAALSSGGRSRSLRSRRNHNNAGISGPEISSAIEYPNVARHYGGKGTPQRIRQQRGPRPRVSRSGTAGQIGAAGGQHGCADRRGAPLLILEEQPTPPGVEDQVGGQRNNVIAGFSVTPGRAQSVDRGRGGHSDVGVQRGPCDRKHAAGRHIAWLTYTGVPAGDALLAG